MTPSAHRACAEDILAIRRELNVIRVDAMAVWRISDHLDRLRDRLAAEMPVADERACTCHPNERPFPCPKKYALSECVAAAVAADPWRPKAPDENALARYKILYEGLARAECARQDIDPDDIIADGGHLAWHLVGYEAALKGLGGEIAFNAAIASAKATP